MRSSAAFLALVLALLASAKPALAESAHAVLSAAIAAMGGAQRLRGIHELDYTAVGERAMVEQSERPTGPYFLDHFRISEQRDLAQRRTRIEEVHSGYAADAWWLQQPDPTQQAVVINGDVAAVESDGNYQYAGGYYVQENDEQFALAPERLLLTAQASKDLHALHDVVLHGVVHHVVAFTWHGAPCTLSINAAANLPWRLVYTRPYPYQVFLNPWGDVTTSITYTGWSLEPYGIRYPREWTIRRVGLPDRVLSFVKLRINDAPDAKTMTLPAAFVAAHRGGPRAEDEIPLGFGGNGHPQTLAPGVVLYPGGWNVGFIVQSDGVVAIEAPWSTGYTKHAFGYARATFGKPIKAVVTTSDSWPHIAGVRQAVAEGIPVYALDLNVPILTRLLHASHAMRPDDLQRHPRAAHLRIVRGPTTVGSGPNRITIVPYRTITAERQMMVWMPGRRLLYTSDLFAPNGKGTWFTPEYLDEATRAIARNHLTPTTVWGMHYGPTPYATLLHALQTFRENGT